MTNKELRLQIRALGEGRLLPPNKKLGLCYFLWQNHTYNQCQTVMDLMDCWPDNSGNTMFPVPHSRRDPGEVYRFLENLWQPKLVPIKSDKEYIENRLSMCRYIARKLAQLEAWK